MVRKRRGGGGGGPRGGGPGGGGPRPGGGGGAPSSGPSGAERIFVDVSYWEARAIQTATVLDLFTLLADGPSTAEDVSVRLATDKRATELLMNALVEIGYLQKKADRFTNAPHAQAHLVRGSKGYVGWTVMLEANSWNLWGNLEASVRSGKRPELPRLYRDDVERTRTLLKSLHARAEALFTRHVVERVRMDEAEKLLDLGGGLGTYTVAFCRRWPKLNATLFELPIALELAKETISKTDVHKRITFVEGDYRKDPLGEAFDIAFLSNVIHSEGEVNAKALVKKVYDALVPGGRIVLRDMFLGPDRTGPAGAVFSLNMLLNTDEGRCYTGAEVEAMLKDAGFAEIRVIDANVLLEARKPGGPPRPPPEPPRPREPREPRKPQPPRTGGGGKPGGSKPDAPTGKVEAAESVPSEVKAEEPASEKPPRKDGDTAKTAAVKAEANAAEAPAVEPPPEEAKPAEEAKAEEAKAEESSDSKPEDSSSGTT